jgi:hypothetical protein
MSNQTGSAAPFLLLTVVLKPTGFMEDEVMLTGIALGGLSEVRGAGGGGGWVGQRLRDRSRVSSLACSIWCGPYLKACLQVTWGHRRPSCVLIHACVPAC